MANVIAIHIDGNGQYKYNLNAGYMLSYVVANNHKGKFFIGKSDISVADSAKQIISENPDCIIFTFAKYNHYISIALSKELKNLNPDVKIFFGGFFAAGNAELILSNYSFIDGCFLSEGEETLLAVLNNISTNKDFFEGVNHIAYFDKETKTVKRIFKVTEQIDLSKIPSPYNDIIDPVVMNQQYGCVFLASSRGCKFACTYCFHPLLRKKIRHFDLEQVVQSIKTISSKFKKTDTILIDFWDDFFISDRDYTIALCKRIEEETRSFNCTVKIKIDTRIDYIDEEVLIYLKRANIYYIGFGLENAIPKILQEMNKLGENISEQKYIDFLAKFKPILNICKKMKIRTGVYIIHGWHNETLTQAKQTLEFCENLHPDEIHQHNLAYYKGSKIYPSGYENEYYLYAHKNPELYKYNLDMIPESKLDPFIKHYKANHRMLILTGVQDSRTKITNETKFQNLVCLGDTRQDFIYKNSKMNACVSLMDSKQNAFYFQISPLHEAAFDEEFSFKKYSSLDDKLHIIRKAPFLPKKNTFFFYEINLKNTKKLNKYLSKGNMNSIPMNICSIYDKCGAEQNYRIFVGTDGDIYTCPNGVKLGTQDNSSEEINKKYNEILQNNKVKYGCNSCSVKDFCSKCPKLLNKYGTKYCDFMKKRRIGTYQKYLIYLETRYYFESPVTTQDFFFEEI